MSDPRYRRSTASVELGGLEAARNFFLENPTPDVIVIETNGDRSAVLSEIDELSDVCDVNTKVIVVGHSNDVGLYRALVKKGVSDYMTAPITADGFREALNEVTIDDEAAALARVISFIGAKGGVGSSTLACNTAWCLGQMFSEDVALLDLDVSFGTAGLAFNLESQQDIKSALAERQRLDDVLLDKVMPKYDDHLTLFTAPASLDIDPEIEVESFESLLNLVRQRSTFVVLDLPHTWSPWVRDILLSSNEIVISATLDLACLRDVKNLVERLRSWRGETGGVRVVLNKVGQGRRTELSAKDFQGAIGGEPDLTLPFDPALFGAAANNGQMIGETHKKHKVVEGFRALALAVSGRAAPVRERRRLPFLKRTAS